MRVGYATFRQAVRRMRWEPCGSGGRRKMLFTKNEQPTYPSCTYSSFFSKREGNVRGCLPVSPPLHNETPNKHTRKRIRVAAYPLLCYFISRWKWGRRLPVGMVLYYNVDNIGWYGSRLVFGGGFFIWVAAGFLQWGRGKLWDGPVDRSVLRAVW